MFEFDHPLYRPLWVRALLVLVILGWGGFELLTGSPGWAMMFLSLGVFLIWALLIRFQKKDD
ncbi:DUF3329 domain-containing protein [Celeribacter sp. SCSIO 80788]|uniref:DUF3329 domain-containing protein n=1 Tax=Celeribacter sp. SCSIO 80788 TaxID=3117013 RepID=UPI003DA41727